MQKRTVDVILLNLKVFLLSIFILFLIAINMGLIAHDANRQKFVVIYFAFAIGHMLLNLLFINPLKVQFHLLRIAIFEVILLYSFVAYFFS
jgi:hypothetical protein